MPSSITIPDNLINTHVQMHGDAGAEWVRKLPDLIAQCERRWSLSLLSPFPGLWYNYVSPARRRDGSDAVLKVCYPDREFRTEVEALRLYDGRGAVQMLDFDLDWGVILLEHISPGTMLVTVDDDAEATSIAAEVMKQIWRPVPEVHPFPTVRDWGKGFTRMRAHFGGTSGPFPEKLTDEAERLFDDLLASMDTPVVLHGDLHHYNILAAQRQPWLAIDPKGVVGEPAYETGALLRNPDPAYYASPDASLIARRRIHQLAEELGMDRERIQAWGVAQAVLSAWWSIEDGGDDDSWKSSIAFAEMLSAVKV